MPVPNHSLQSKTPCLGLGCLSKARLSAWYKSLSPIQDPLQSKTLWPVQNSLPSPRHSPIRNALQSKTLFTPGPSTILRFCLRLFSQSKTLLWDPSFSKVPNSSYPIHSHQNPCRSILIRHHFIPGISAEPKPARMQTGPFTLRAKALFLYLGPALMRPPLQHHPSQLCSAPPGGRERERLDLILRLYPICKNCRAAASSAMGG